MGHNKGEFSSLQGTEGSGSSPQRWGSTGFPEAGTFLGHNHSFGPGGITGVKEQERGWEVAGTSARSVQSHRGLGGVSERVQSHRPCNAALLRGWEVNRGHLEGEEPGTARGVKGSSGGSG